MSQPRSDAKKARELFAEIEPMLDRDPALARRVAVALRKASGPTRPRRRAAAMFDPVARYREAPDRLRSDLEALDIEQLKDMVSHYAMDPRKLALKWKKPERLVDLIADVVEQRVHKGDAFRGANVPSDEAPSGETSAGSSSGDRTTRPDRRPAQIGPPRQAATECSVQRWPDKTLAQPCPRDRPAPRSRLDAQAAQGRAVREGPGRGR